MMELGSLIPRLSNDPDILESMVTVWVECAFSHMAPVDDLGFASPAVGSRTERQKQLAHVQRVVCLDTAVTALGAKVMSETGWQPKETFDWFDNLLPDRKIIRDARNAGMHPTQPQIEKSSMPGSKSVDDPLTFDQWLASAPDSSSLDAVPVVFALLSSIAMSCEHANQSLSDSCVKTLQHCMALAPLGAVS